jgi:hypothetical protein
VTRLVSAPASTSAWVRTTTAVARTDCPGRTVVPSAFGKTYEGEEAAASASTNATDERVTLPRFSSV